MLYIGYFDFTQEEEEPEYGNFTCLAKADSPDKATHVFRDLLLGLRKKGELSGERCIYLETIIEVGQIPSKGVLARYTSIPGNRYDVAAIHGDLPFQEKTGCQAFSLAPDDMTEEEWAHWEKTGEMEVEPFLDFKTH